MSRLVHSFQRALPIKVYDNDVGDDVALLELEVTRIKTEKKAARTPGKQMVTKQSQLQKVLGKLTDWLTGNKLATSVEFMYLLGREPWLLHDKLWSKLPQGEGISLHKASHVGNTGLGSALQAPASLNHGVFEKVQAVSPLLEPATIQKVTEQNFS